jgi:flagellar assembly factor FliW
MIVETKYFGAAEYPESAIIHFPQGLPGFEGITDFLCLEQPSLRPLAYLQSVTEPQVCFLTLPVRAIEPSYHVQLEPADACILKLGSAQPRIGREIACIAILCAGPDRIATGNLAAPVVINIEERLGLQVIQRHSEYDCAHPLHSLSQEEAVC